MASSISTVTSESDTLSTANGLALYTTSYRPEAPPQAVVVIVHGIGEHCGRYQHVAEWLCAHGYAVSTLDLCGHGQSEGARVIVDTFNDYADDVDSLITHTEQRFPGIPLFLLGHSMGGTIILYYALTHTRNVRGLILSGAALEMGSDIPLFLQRISHLLGKLLPKLPTIKLASAGLCSDEKVAQAYDADPLVYHGGIPARTGSELIKAVAFIRENLSRLQLPALILHGEKDPLVNAVGSQSLYDEIASEDKKLVIYSGFYHEILNEPEREQVLQEIGSWLDTHLDGQVE